MIKLLVCGDVKTPKRNVGDAGIDFFVPNYSDEFRLRLIHENDVFDVFDNEDGERSDISIGKRIRLEAGADIKIPSMVRALIPENECLRMSNKSGVALNQKLIVGAEIIDSSYEGEMNLHVFNASNSSVEIEFGQKLVQGIPIVVDVDPIEVVDNRVISVAEFYSNHEHTRGEGGFGSTGLN